jgi:hypothetical protein
MLTKKNPIDYIKLGILSGSWIKDIKTGDTLCDRKNNYSRVMKFPAPVLVLLLSQKLRLT